jgi:hypothetical protein
LAGFRTSLREFLHRAGDAPAKDGPGFCQRKPPATALIQPRAESGFKQADLIAYGGGSKIEACGSGIEAQEPGARFEGAQLTPGQARILRRLLHDHRTTSNDANFTCSPIR